jgi:pimeloyl-ACP methyl ester carboxylesterase
MYHPLRTAGIRRHAFQAVALAALAAALAPGCARAQEALLWGSLRPGPHAVGFRALYQLDHTRQYDPDYRTDTARPPVHRPRPILLCVWYPARATTARRLAYREYLRVPSDDPRVAPLARRLMPHVREVVCEETIGKKPGALSRKELAAFEHLLTTTAYAVKDAPAAEARFPVVVYHPGLGGSYEDNSVLFEYLASHGYVVLSSAYPKADASVMNIDWDLRRSFRDMEFLARYACALPFADARLLAAMGHSYGAQAALAWCAEPGSAVRAAVSIDSTVENVGIDYPGFAKLKAHLQQNKRNVRAATLRFASRSNNPRFATLEPYLKFVPRYEATVDRLDHDDYLTHGAIRPALTPDVWPDKGKARALRRSYDRVCEHVLRFLDASLKQRAGAREFLRRSLRGEGLDEGFRLQFRCPALAPPTARQLALIVQSQGPGRAAELLRSCRDDVDVPAVLGGIRFAVVDFSGQARVDGSELKQTLAFFTLARDIFPKSAAVQQHLGAVREATGDRQGAIAAYRKAIELVPREIADEKAKANEIRVLEARLQKLGWDNTHADRK